VRDQLILASAWRQLAIICTAVYKQASSGYMQRIVGVPCVTNFSSNAGLVLCTVLRALSDQRHEITSNQESCVRDNDLLWHWLATGKSSHSCSATLCALACAAMRVHVELLALVHAVRV
jgi:hypothetical protein